MVPEAISEKSYKKKVTASLLNEQESWKSQKLWKAARGERDPPSQKEYIDVHKPTMYSTQEDKKWFWIFHVNGQ